MAFPRALEQSLSPEPLFGERAFGHRLLTNLPVYALQSVIDDAGGEYCH